MLFVILFVIVGVITILWARGYRFDFEQWSLVKTGALYVQYTPHPAQMFLNKKPQKDTSGIVRRGTLISDILPKSYRFLITKDGYWDYEKNIIVSSAEVTRLNNITLIPKQIAFKTIAEGIKGDKIVDISDNQGIITLDTKKDIYYNCPLSPLSTCTNLTTKIKTLVKGTIHNISFYPHESTVFLVNTSLGVYRANIAVNEAKALYKGLFIFADIAQNNLYVAGPKIVTTTDIATSSDKRPQTDITIYDLSLSSQAGTVHLPFDPNTISNIAISPSMIAILLQNGQLFLYDQNEKSLRSIADAVHQVKFSPDGGKLLYQDKDGKVFVYFVQEDIASLDRQAGDKMQLALIDIAHIQNIVWNDGYHLVLTYPNKITLAEISPFQPNNQYPLFTNTASTTDTFFKNRTLYAKTGDFLKQYQIGS